MGRSVNYLNDSRWTLYFDVDDHGRSEDEDGNEEYWDFLAEEDWESFMDHLEEIITDHYPSFDKTKEWEGNEVRIFLENKLVKVGISEYGGMASLSFAPIGEEKAGLADNLIQKMRKKLSPIFLERFPDKVYYKQGTFSNGESVFFKPKRQTKNELELSLIHI